MTVNTQCYPHLWQFELSPPSHASDVLQYHWGIWRFILQLHYYIIMFVKILNQPHLYHGILRTSWLLYCPSFLTLCFWSAEQLSFLGTQNLLLDMTKHMSDILQSCSAIERNRNEKGTLLTPETLRDWMKDTAFRMAENQSKKGLKPEVCACVCVCMGVPVCMCMCVCMCVNTGVMKWAYSLFL